MKDGDDQDVMRWQELETPFSTVPMSCVSSSSRRRWDDQDALTCDRGKNPLLDGRTVMFRVLNLTSARACVRGHRQWLVLPVSAGSLRFNTEDALQLDMQQLAAHEGLFHGTTHL